MNKTQRGDMVIALLPGAKYEGCWYDDSIIWKDERPFPTEEEINAEWDRQQAIKTKAAAVEAIYAEFVSAQLAPVVCTVPEGTFTMNGGYPSVQYIQGAYNLSEALGEEQVYLTDVNNQPHLMTLESAKSIAVQIGVKWRDAFFIKQLALNDLEG